MPRQGRSYLVRDVLELERMGLLPRWSLSDKQERLVLLLKGGGRVKGLYCSEAARLLEVTHQAVQCMLRLLVHRANSEQSRRFALVTQNQRDCA